jgi:hypothetical protein
MAHKHYFFTVLLVGCVILSSCAPSVTKGTATPASTPTPEIKVEHIFDLIGQGAITFKITSGAINELGLDVRNTTDQSIFMDIPAGTYFVNADPKSQNMVVRHPASATIPPNEHVDIQLEAACANLHLTEPTQENTFTVQRTPTSIKVGRIIDKLNSAQVDYPVEQAAIWIVTDDATFDELGMLVEGSRFGTSIINENAALRAMMLVDQAGLNIRADAIWGDRSQLMTKAPEPDLSAWLANQVATQAVEDATQAVAEATQSADVTKQAAQATKQEADATQQALQTATVISRVETQTAQAFSAPNGKEISQYPVKATASSQYSVSGWSAMNAAGEPDTTSCGDNSTAWASQSSTGKDWLLLTYDQPVIPTRIVIHQTYNPGAVSMVEVIEPTGDDITVYEADPAVISQCPYALAITVKNVTTPVKAIRVTIDQSKNHGWNEIDAVQLIGLPK